MDAIHTPVELTHHREQGRLEVVWADGHRSDFPALELRLRCPCAECLTGGETRTRPAPPTGLSISKVEPFGNYAVVVTFSDGHSAGVYRWEYLRYWCPCDGCWSQRESAGEQEIRGDQLAAVEAANCSSCAASPTEPVHGPQPQPLTFRTP